jgi:hypothetical protein
MARDEVRRWLAVVEIDLKTARNCIEGPFFTPESAAYHC